MSAENTRENTESLIVELSHHKDAPCLSLYQPTHRHHPDNTQDPLRFRQLIEAAEKSLAQSYPHEVAVSLLAPLKTLASDNSFWNHTLDGLAIFSAPGLFRALKVQRALAESVIVAGSFHIKPLLRILQSADRFQVLALDLDELKMYEGHRNAIDEIDLAPGVPRTATEALAMDVTGPHLAGSPVTGKGYGGKPNEIDFDAERYFRIIDRAILLQHSNPSGLPLILAALPEHQSLFRSISRNPALLPKGIEKHPDVMSLNELGEHAWGVVRPFYLAKLSELVEIFGAAKARQKGTDDLRQVAHAAVDGRIDTLLIEAERKIAGHINADTGEIQKDELTNPAVDDLLDDLGQYVLEKGGRVVVAPREQMPTQSGVAAIFRY